MPKTFVSRSTTINAPKDKVKAVVGDLHNWQPWSPWLICEPEAKVDVQPDGKFYTWEGHRVGSGNLKITNETEDKIEYDLNFLKPWKTSSKVEFKFNETSEGTETTWTMASSLPFFMFWMKKKMEAFIGMDYDRGLKMLKEHTEKGSVDSKLEFLKNEYEGCNYIGVKTESSFDKIGDAMKNDFNALGDYIKSNNLEVNGLPFSQYHKFDPVSGKVIYTAGFPLKDIPNDLDAKFKKGNLPKSKFNTVRHHGTYDHLGNAWNANAMMMRNKEFKPAKGYHPVEFYLNDPSETAPQDLITDVSFAVK